MSETTKTKARNIVEGEVEVCCHRVAYWYGLEDHERTETLEKVLEAEAESRSKTCINEGFYSGELNCLYTSGDGSDPEIRGWWKIVTEEK